MKNKILILGSSGMLGHMLLDYLGSKEIYTLFDISRQYKTRAETNILDVNDSNSLREVIESVEPDFIINCIGVLIKESNRSIEKAIRINSALPHLLSHIAGDVGSKLIHISTDCVFSGAKGDYSVSDFRDADDIYGRTKALGELNNSRDMTLRTSIIGPELKEEGEGLFHWFVKQKGQVMGFSNVYWSGLTTLQLAKEIEGAINVFEPGLYNVSNNQKISKYELLLIIADIFELTIRLIPSHSKSCDKSLVNSYKGDDYALPDYKSMIADLRLLMENSVGKRYKHYSAFLNG